MTAVLIGVTLAALALAAYAARAASRAYERTADVCKDMAATRAAIASARSALNRVRPDSPAALTALYDAERAIRAGQLRRRAGRKAGGS